MSLKNGVAMYLLVSDIFQNYIPPPVLAGIRKGTNFALKKFVHRIPIRSVIVTGSTVTESWDDLGRGGRRRNLCTVIAKLQDFWAEWPGHSTCFILLYGFLVSIFSPSAFKELCASYMKMHVGCQVKHTLFVFGFYNNMSKTKDARFYSKDA